MELLPTTTQISFPPVVGLVGYKQSGKSSFAQLLADYHGFIAMAFADPLKEAALALDPIIEEAPFQPLKRLSNVVDALGWDLAKETYPEVRRTLQRFGTEAIRAQDPNFWIRQLSRRVLSSSQPVVVHDVRFPNEADLIRGFGGIVVRVVRDVPRDANSQHVSETATETTPVDLVIDNNGTLADLEAQVPLVLDKLPTLF